MKWWKKYVIMLSIIAGVVLLTGGQEGVFAEEPEREILSIVSGGQQNSVPDNKETAPNPGPGAFTMGSPTGAEAPEAQYDFPLMQLIIDVSNNVPRCSGDPNYTLEVVAGMDVFLWEDEEKQSPIPGWEDEEQQIPISGNGTHTFSLSALPNPLWVEVAEPSEEWGDIKISASYEYMVCDYLSIKDTVNATAVLIDLDIHHGNSEHTEVAEEEEETSGALTTVDGYKHVGVDLMKLVIRRQPETFPLEGLPLTETLKISILAGAEKVFFWETAAKKNLIVPGVGGTYEFSLTELDKTIWVEVTEPSNTFGDIKVELRYREGKDMVITTGIWPEIDVREHSRPYNRVGRNDPRMCENEWDDDCYAMSSLLVWQENSSQNISFEVIKVDGNVSPLWIQVRESLDLDGLNPDLYLGTTIAGQRIFKASALTTQLETYTLETRDTLLGAYFAGEFTVEYGLDYDNSHTLSGEEIVGRYEVFGITANEVADARRNYKLFYETAAVDDLGEALCHRFSRGRWLEPKEEDPYAPDYRPDNDGSCAEPAKTPNACQPQHQKLLNPAKRQRLTHNFGATIVEKPSPLIKEEYGKPGYFRPYSDVDVTVPIYEFNKDNSTSQLIINSVYFREKLLKSYIFDLSYADIHAAYTSHAAHSSGGEIAVVFPLKKGGDINFTPLGDVGLGYADLNPEQDGSMTLKITPVPNMEAYDIAKIVEVESVVEDGWDYNYFKPELASYTFASISGSSIQCSFGKYTGGEFEKAGQVPRLKFHLKGETDLAPFSVDTGSLPTKTIATFRIDKTNNRDLVDENGTVIMNADGWLISYL